MKKIITIISLLAALGMCFTGCGNKASDNGSASDNQEAVAQDGNITDNQNAEIDYDKATVYQHTEDSDGSMVLSVNEDGTINAFMEDGKFVVTFPAEWNDHFIIKDKKVYSKLAYQSQSEDGLIMTFNTDTMRMFSPSYRLAGCAEDMYLYLSTPEESGCSSTDQAAADEYKKLNADANTAFNTIRSKNADGKMTRAFEFSDSLQGTVSVNFSFPEKNKMLGYTDESIMGSGELTVKTNLKEKTKVNIKSCVLRNNNTFFNCTDAESGEEYGWVIMYDILI